MPEINGGGEYAYTYGSDPSPSKKGEFGKLLSIKTPGGVETGFTYNGALMDRIVWRRDVSTTHTAENGSLDWTYADDLRMNSMMIESGGEGDSFMFHMAYDDDDMLTSINDPDGNPVFELSRDEHIGRLTGTALRAEPGGDARATDTLVYSAFGELAEYRAFRDGLNLLRLQYKRDHGGRITRKVETTLSDSPTTYSYNYDAAGHLWRVWRSDDTVSPLSVYTYDPNGNRTSYSRRDGRFASVGAPEIETDAQDRLLRYGALRFAYNRNGEMIQKVDSDAGTTTTYSYDAFGNLAGVALAAADGATTEIAYVLDPAGRRVGKKIGSNGAPPQLAQQFIYYDKIRPAAELDADGNIVSAFIYAPGRHVPDYMVKPSGANAGIYRFITDHLGSVRLVVKVSDGSIVQRLDYDEYGRSLEDSNPGFQPFGFAGGLLDRDTALIHFGAREYNAVAGRWITKDPAGFDGGANFYSYVFNSPANYVDPNGLWERNVHYDDTYNACLDIIGDSFVCGSIAKADQKFDDDPETDPPNIIGGGWVYGWWPGHGGGHFPPDLAHPMGEAYDAIRIGNIEDFGRALHRVQDYWSHSYHGYGPGLGHWTHSTDDVSKHPWEHAQTMKFTRHLIKKWKENNPTGPKKPPDFGYRGDNSGGTYISPF